MRHGWSANPIAFLLLLLLGFAVSPAEAVTGGSEPPGSSTPVGLDLAKWKGRVVLLDFWASWCGPCRESFPWMAEMVARHGAEGLVVVTVNLDQDRAAADRFLGGRRFDFEYLYDPEGRLAEKWSIQSMPASILFDREGKEAFRHMGFRQEDAATYEAHIRELLAGEAHIRVPLAGAKEGAGQDQPPGGDGPPVEEIGRDATQAPEDTGEPGGRKAGRRIGARPWERACLARPAMRFDGAPIDLAFDEHIYFSREASSGGRGFGGGGCGCN